MVWKLVSVLDDRFLFWILESFVYTEVCVYICFFIDEVCKSSFLFCLL